MDDGTTDGAQRARSAAFDGFAADWDTEHGPASRRGDEFQARIAVLRHLCAAGRPRVLEVGCATGQNLLALADVLHDGVGIDFSPAMIARARANAVAAGADRLRFEVGDMNAVSQGLVGGAYDLILFVGVLEHLTDQVGALAIARDRLRTGGRIVVITPHRDNPAFLWQRIVKRRRPRLFETDRHVTPASLRRLGADAGLAGDALYPLPCRPAHEGDAAPPTWARAMMAMAARVPMPVMRGAFALVLRPA